jgi:hemerythrin
MKKYKSPYSAIIKLSNNQFIKYSYVRNPYKLFLYLGFHFKKNKINMGKIEVSFYESTGPSDYDRKEHRNIIIKTSRDTIKSIFSNGRKYSEKSQQILKQLIAAQHGLVPSLEKGTIQADLISVSYF